MSPAELKIALERMYLIRFFEEGVNHLFSAGRLSGTTHLCIGQEAVATGACLALLDGDQVISNHRGHGHLLARGGDPGRLMAELFGRSGGYSRGRGGSQHMTAPDIGFLASFGITGSGIAFAAGAALAFCMRRQKQAALCFFGDGAANTGSFHEALNMAALWRLPLLLVCENNGYAMSTSFRDSTRSAGIAARGGAYGIPGVTVDGNRVEEVHAAVSHARQRAVDGQGPTLVECLTYRFTGHSKSDRCEYRTRAEEAEWRLRDPILLLEKELTEAGILDADMAEAARERARERVRLATDFAEGSPPMPVAEYLQERID